MISVILITYNQEKYVRQSLDSILMQQVNGDVEIIAADDCSTDETLKIINKYAVTSPFPFTFLPQKNNLGFVKNYQRAFAACTGKYIAVMEGDDYWTDPKRLQKHIVFLEEHPRCVMAMNRFSVLNEFSNTSSIAEWEGDKDYLLITGKELALENKLGNLSACVFRTSEIVKLEPALFALEVADWMIGMVLSQYGPIAILKEVMSVYRIHREGQWSKLNVREQADKMNTVIDSYNRYLDYRYDHEFSLYKDRLNDFSKISYAGKNKKNSFLSKIKRAFKLGSVIT